MKRFFSIIRILIALCRCELQINQFDQLIFLTKIGHVIYKLGGIKLFDLVGACQSKSKLDAKFENEIE
jgi:hypothetical protein